MVKKIQMIRKLVPDLSQELIKRYRILHTVKLLEPCGRRVVVLSLGMTERTVRSEIEKLNAQGLIIVTKTGMSVTKDGVMVLKTLQPIFAELTGLSELEEQIKQKMGARAVRIAQGNYEQSERTQKELSQIAVHVLLDTMRKNSRIAIAGGTTMAAVVEAMPYTTVHKAELVLPARGSVGRKLELQADTLAAKLAEKVGAEYRMLHLPDNLSKVVLEEMKKEPEIAETIQELQNIDILLLGVGNALEMAKKRRLDAQTCAFLKKKHAVAEACGYYFDHNGTVVYETESIGVEFSKLSHIKVVVVAAGGKQKAASLLSLSKSMKNGIFVIDESAAWELLRLAQG